MKCNNCQFTCSVAKLLVLGPTTPKTIQEFVKYGAYYGATTTYSNWLGSEECKNCKLL